MGHPEDRIIVSAPVKAFGVPTIAERHVYSTSASYRNALKAIKDNFAVVQAANLKTAEQIATLNAEVVKLRVDLAASQKANDGLTVGLAETRVQLSLFDKGMTAFRGEMKKFSEKLNKRFLLFRLMF